MQTPNHKSDIRVLGKIMQGSKVLIALTLICMQLTFSGCDIPTQPTPTNKSSTNDPFSFVSSLAISPDGNTLAAGYGGLVGDYVVRVWDLRQPNKDPVVLSGHSSYVDTVAFSADGKLLASGSDDGTVLLWNADKLTATPEVLKAGGYDVKSIALSPDGKLMAGGGGDDSIVWLWDLSQISNAPIPLKGQQNSNSGTSISFSPDGTRLAVAEDSGVRIWYLQTLQSSTTLLRATTEPILALAFSPDGRMLAEGGVDRSIRLWTLQPQGSFTLEATLKGHEGSITSLAFSIDSKMLISGSDDKTVRIWSVEQPDKAPIVLSGYQTAVHSIALSPDGMELASSSGASIQLRNFAMLTAAPTVIHP